MITVLLEKIITILEGWIQSFTSHAQHVEDKLDSLDQTASDIKTNTEPISDIKDNTGAVITPIQNIKTNTDSIATSSQTSANNTTAIFNNVGTLSTNTGRAAAFAEDCANNTLEIKDKITTIASDTTQLRADSANIAADVSSINQAIGYYVANTLVTEESEGALCNFDTDLEDYLQKAVVTIPADLTGFSGINIEKFGKNLLQNTSTTQSLNGIDFTVYSDGSINVNGTASADTDLTIKSALVLPTESYTLTGCPSGGSTSTYRLFATNFGSDVGTGLNFNGNGITATTIRVNIKSGTVCNNLLFKPMIRIAGNNFAYEPYKAMTYPVSFGTTITDGAEINLLDGIIKVNSTPVSYLSISPIAVRTNKGINNIYSDIGTTALTYRETLKKYLEKHNQ